MPVQQTSLDAYNWLVDSGNISRARLEALREVVRLTSEEGYDDVTGGEVNNSLTRVVSNPSYHRRLDELLTVGILVNGPVRECRVSQRQCATYKLSPTFVVGVAIDWSLIRPESHAASLSQGIADIRGRRLRTESATKILEALDNPEVRAALARATGLPADANGVSLEHDVLAHL